MIRASYDFNGVSDPFTFTGSGYAEAGGFGVITAAGGGLDAQVLELDPAILSSPMMTFVIYAKVSATTNLNMMIGITEASGIDFHNLYAFYAAGNSGKIFSYDGSTGSELSTFTANVSKKFTILCRPNFFFNLYIDDVYKATSVNKGSGYDTVGRPLSLRVQVDTIGSGGTVSLSSFVCDDRQSIPCEFSLTSGSGFSEYAAPNLGIETAPKTGLSEGTTYYFKNRLEVAGEFSDYSSEVSATTNGDSPTSEDDGEDLLALGDL